MTSSLVGSEMCIRDSPLDRALVAGAATRLLLSTINLKCFACLREGVPPVSYTHLTLPTICSV
eukprot:6193290-Prorocentrum_lima.AAC.1